MLHLLAKRQISGAMDKFTARSNVGAPVGGGVAAKRTKTVLKSRTYMEGGYMKTVREEVEVTDDEEVRACVLRGVFSSVLFFAFNSGFGCVCVCVCALFLSTKQK